MTEAGPRHATDEDGVKLYVVAESSWGRTSSWLVRAGTLMEAKSQHGWTRQQHTTRKVRRAKPSDLETMEVRGG